MAFLGRLFRRDPRQTLQKAEEWLARGQGVRALHAAEDVAREAEGSLLEEAEDLVRRSHEAIMTNALKEATLSKNVGDWQEAADWLHTALEHCPDEERQEEIRGLREALLRRAKAEAEESTGVVLAATDESPLADDEIVYEMLVASFAPEVQELYEDRPEDFRRAVVTMHGGAPEAALEILERLLAKQPQDPVLRLEAGQCRLALGKAVEAREDFEAVEATFGETFLDAGERVSVPVLLATAMLEAGRPAELLERFEGRVDLDQGSRALGQLWSRALLESEQTEEALSAYLTLANRFPGDAELAFEVAQILDAEGYEEEAIARLERVVAPSCSTGNCSRPALFLPAARLLASL
ncbi:MAG: tetratricopeptide repeat protein, partial [Acidobacteria bacterium]|nr:tetratricopeptide repeat protein [Acidobacteriota bacterium]